MSDRYGLTSFIKAKEKEAAAAREMQAEQIQEQQQLVGWGRIPAEALQTIDAKMAVFKGDLIAADQSIAWDPKQFRVKKMSETEGVLILEPRGEKE